jgi:hypothetical protein
MKDREREWERGRTAGWRRIPARRIGTIVALLLVGAGAGIWAVQRSGGGVAAAPDVSTPVAVEPEHRTERLDLLPEPEAPPRGSAAHAAYFRALVSGEERSLETIRSALAAAEGEKRGAKTDHVRRLQDLERAYSARLVRHRHELGDEPRATTR